MYSKHGPSYHWVPELFRRLGLPVFEGLQEQLEALNRRRKAELDLAKTEVAKRRRIQLKESWTPSVARSGPRHMAKIPTVPMMKPIQYQKSV